MQLINYNLMRVFAQSFCFENKKILEVGSYTVKNQERVMQLRPFFNNNSYLGIDMRKGNGVDKVENVENLSFKDNSFDLVICLDTFEHVKNPIKAIAEIFRVLKPDGIVVLSSVMNFAIHEYPSDYWRFTPQIFTVLTEKFSYQYIGHFGLSGYPQNVYAICQKGGKSTAFDEKMRIFNINIRTISYNSISENFIHYAADTFRHFLRLFNLFHIEFQKVK